LALIQPDVPVKETKPAVTLIAVIIIGLAPIQSLQIHKASKKRKYSAYCYVIGTVKLSQSCTAEFEEPMSNFSG